MKTKNNINVFLCVFFVSLLMFSCMSGHETNSPSQPGKGGKGTDDNAGTQGNQNNNGGLGAGNSGAGEIYDLSVALQEEQDAKVTAEVLEDMYRLAGKPFGTPCELYVEETEKEKYEKTAVDIELSLCVADYNALILENGVFRTQAYDGGGNDTEGVGNHSKCDDYGLRHKAKMSIQYQEDANPDNQTWLHPQFVDFWLSKYKHEKEALSTDCIYFKTAEFGIDQTEGESKEDALMGTEVKSNGKPWKTYVWLINGDEGTWGWGPDAASFKISFKLEYYRLKDEFRNPPAEEEDEEESEE